MLLRTLFLAHLLATASMLAASAAGDAAAMPVSIPYSQRLDFVSKVNAQRYSISVALPFERAPAGGFAVLYVLDAYSNFGSATEMVRGILGARSIVVVGIGYPEDAEFAAQVLARRGPRPPAYAKLSPAMAAAQLQRTYDLTLPASDAVLATEKPPSLPQLNSRNVGGLDDFLKILETEIKPRVAALVRVDAANQTLFGHSAGGLAVLHALFVEPNAFRTFIVASAAIWWNDKAVLADRPRFAAAVESGRASPRVLITVGGLESTPPRMAASPGLDPAAVDAAVRMAKMVENSTELANWLKTLKGRSGYQIDYAVFEGERHAASNWLALIRGIEFAYP